MNAQVSIGRRFSEAFSDTSVMTRRNILRFVRLPQLLAFNTVLYVVLLLLFNYVFGGAIGTGGMKYIQYLLPGFLVQTVVFGSSQTSVGIAEDLSKGIIDRYRSLPIARSAFFNGRIIADALRYAIVILLMIALGSAIGFRFENGAGPAVAAVTLTILFGLALSWLAVFIGISSRDVETAQVAGFVWVFPLVFASSLFVPIETMPGWLQAFAKINPVTTVVDTVRALCLGGEVIAPLWKMLAWTGGIILIFTPLTIRRYRLMS
jgi:ABC transporter DrrB family efflux protein